MKLFLTIFFVLISQQLLAGPKVEFRLSKVHALINFTETIAGQPHRSRALRQYFEKSTFNTKDNQELLQKWKSIYQSLHHGWSYKGYPSSRYMGNSHRLFFLMQATYAKDLQELSQRTLGILPLSDHNEYFRLLSQIEKIYEKLIWNPNFEKLKSYKKRLEDIARRVDLDYMFSRAAHFYKASWPEKTDFTISLYPIPGSTGHSSAESIFSIESVGVLIDEKDIAGRFAVVFHEIAHSLYESQTKAFQSTIDKMFKSSPSKHATLAYSYWNEALATALGNGWAYKRVTGKLDKLTWYNDPVIEDFARALFPKVESYLKQKRQIDQSFVKHTIKQFEKTFPDIIYRYDALFNKALIAHDKDIASSRELIDLIRQDFLLRSAHTSAPINNQKTLDILKNSSDSIIFVVNPSNEETLDTLKNQFQDLRPYLNSLPSKANSLISYIDSKGRLKIVILISEKRLLTKALEKLKSLKTVKKDSAVFSF